MYYHPTILTLAGREDQGNGMKRWSDSVRNEGTNVPKTGPREETTMVEERTLTLDELQPKPADMSWWTWITTVVLNQVVSLVEEMIGPKTGEEKKAAVLDLLAAAWRQYSPIKILIGLQVLVLRSVAGRLIDKLVTEYNERGWPKLPITP